MFTEMFWQTGAQVIAVDISADLLAKARERGCRWIGCGSWKSDLKTVMWMALLMQ